MVVPIVAIDTLSLTNLASAQQDSTASSLTAPSLTAQVGEGSIELSWATVQGAARYEMWVWDSVNDWRQLGGNTLTGTSCSHTDVAVGTTYLYTICTVDAGGQSSPWSPNLYVTVPAQERVSQQQQEATITPTPTVNTDSATDRGNLVALYKAMGLIYFSSQV